MKNVNNGDNNLIPQVIINNSGPTMIHLSNEFIQVILTNKTPKQLYDNLKYFETTCAYINKQADKCRVAYDHMLQEGSAFQPVNPFSIMDCIHLYSHSLVGILTQSDDLDNELQRLQELTQDILRVLVHVVNVDVNDSRIANFYLVNQRIQ